MFNELTGTANMPCPKEDQKIEDVLKHCGAALKDIPSQKGFHLGLVMNDIPRRKFDLALVLKDMPTKKEFGLELVLKEDRKAEQALRLCGAMLNDVPRRGLTLNIADMLIPQPPSPTDELVAITRNYVESCEKAYRNIKMTL